MSFSPLVAEVQGGFHPPPPPTRPVLRSLSPSSPVPFLIASQSYRTFADRRVMTDGPTRRNEGLDYAGQRRAGGDERWIRGGGGLSCRV